MAVSPQHLGDHLLAHGRPVVTLREVADLLNVNPKHAASALVRLKRANRMFSPARGLYFAVPPEYRTWGAMPALDFIDPMMRAGGYAYYVGYLSAAELHGVAHQHPQVFQVVVDRPIADRDFGRVRVRFYPRGTVGEVPVALMNSRTSQVRVATPATTALDLASRPSNGGGLNNVATVIGEMADDDLLSALDLVSVCGRYPVSALRRLGWLLDHVGADLDTGPLVKEAEARAPGAGFTLLQPGGPRRGHRDPRWRVIVNDTVEADL